MSPLFALLVYLVGNLAFAGPSTKLSPTETELVNQRLRRFYQNSEAAIMNERVPKFSARTGAAVERHRSLRLAKAPTNPLLKLAQKKATPEFQKAQREVFKKHFPGAYGPRVSGTWSAPEANDALADISDGWIAKDKLVYDLDSLPADGETKLDLWSDDYWRTRYGGLAYRYSNPEEYETWEEAADVYAQPKNWDKLVDDLDKTELTQRIRKWSPAEKYDLSLFDLEFPLTNQQKELGEEFLEEDEKTVEDWVGICHGWAAATVMVPRPEKTVKVPGPEKTTITWYPNDIKAVASLLWAEAESDNNFAGVKCEIKNPAYYQNGRMQDQDCFDTNPATFHLALGNQVALAGKTFLMDNTFDYEIWNQPIQSYEFLYFDPIHPEKRSKNWKEVAVPYDASFKAGDRFQKPLTRGQKNEKGVWDDSGVRQIVGVINSIAYIGEVSPPAHTEVANDDELVRVTYTYDLEISEADGKSVVSGGEWHENSHPDFLWVPRKGTRALTSYDTKPIDYSGKREVGVDATKYARKASQSGVPLCEVLSTLIELSTGAEADLCPPTSP